MARARFAQRRTARELLERAIAGSREDAEVLLDVPIESGQTEIAEQLSLGLAGRALTDEILGGQLFLRGDPVPEHLVAANLSPALADVRSGLFPRRRGPCLPNRAALRELVRISSHGSGHDEVYIMRRLWPALERACKLDTRQEREDALELADELLDTHGVETLEVDVRRGPERWGRYLNAGDSYNLTLFWDGSNGRFYVTTYADVVEAWERRYGRVGIVR